MEQYNVASPAQRPDRNVLNSIHPFRSYACGSCSVPALDYGQTASLRKPTGLRHRVGWAASSRGTATWTKVV